MNARAAAAPEAITFVNAHRVGGRGGPRIAGGLRVAGGRIVALGENPQPGDRIVDLEGDRIIPGLINAHDHLQLNSLAPMAAKPYRHVTEWIADINHRRRSDDAFEAQVRVARDARLMVGGIKNLLSGVTTVAHHDPLYASLNRDFPIRVVDAYGWSHSLYLDGEQAVRSSYRRTPIEWPWIIHAAEGVDLDASAEFERLDALKCIGPNTLLVHGVALDSGQRTRLLWRGAGLVWCPSSNLRLFGRTADVADLIERRRIALGTDSRLSGARDLLEELRVAAELSGLDERVLEPLVTSGAARLLRLSDRGILRAGALADLVVLPALARLGSAIRTDVRLVLVGGVACYGDGDMARAAAPSADWAEVRVDGRSKALRAGSAASQRELGAVEQGLEFTDATSRAA
ncbi:MAG: hypothetical protein QOD56_2573 [Gammaproteobacteria bacterium]|nr:hypothetical protein [Gammaproteobacteria bacterium]